MRVTNASGTASGYTSVNPRLRLLPFLVSYHFHSICHSYFFYFRFLYYKYVALRLNYIQIILHQTKIIIFMKLSCPICKIILYTNNISQDKVIAYCKFDLCKIIIHKNNVYQECIFYKNTDTVTIFLPYEDNLK